MGVGHILHRVGNNIARRKRVEHAVVTHGYAIVNGYGVELRSKAALLLDKALYVLSYLMQMHMTRHHLRE